MKREVQSLKTKQRLSASLKKYMQKKPLSRITIRDIIEDCDVNRNTFYYHFVDIYDLLKWTLDQEAIGVVKNIDVNSNPEDAIRFAIDYVRTNSFLLKCALDSMGRESLKRFLYKDFHEIISSIIESSIKTNSIKHNFEFENFLCEFYTEAMAGLLVNLFTSETSENEDKIVEELMVMHDSIPLILNEANKK